MSKYNEITGDKMISKKNNEAYVDGWNRIFGAKKKKKTKEEIKKEIELEELLTDVLDEECDD